MPDQALLLSIALSKLGSMPAEGQVRWQELIDAIEDRLARIRGMEFDGTEWGDGQVTLYCYGAKADRLWTEIEPLLSGVSFPPGSWALKRYGGPDAAGSRIELTPDGIGPSTAVPERKPPKKNYRAGDWILAPIEPGRYVLGRVARTTGDMVFGYFFAPPVERAPVLEHLDRLGPRDAYTYLIFSDLGIRAGDWPVLGQLGRFDAKRWPLAPFENYVAPAGSRAWLEIVTYDEGNINRESSVRRIDPRQRGRLPPAGLGGSAAALIALRKRLED